MRAKEPPALLQPPPELFAVPASGEAPVVPPLPPVPPELLVQTDDVLHAGRQDVPVQVWFS